MTESQWTSKKLLPALRSKMPGALIVKMNDSTTEGLPDFFVSLNGNTTWFEVKTQPPYFKPLQWETLRNLGGYYIIWNRIGQIARLIHHLQPFVKFDAEVFLASCEKLTFDELMMQIYDRCLR